MKKGSDIRVNIKLELEELYDYQNIKCLFENYLYKMTKLTSSELDLE